MNIVDRLKHTSQRGSYPSEAAQPPKLALNLRKWRWARLFSSVFLASAIVVLCLPSAGCNFCGTSCSEGISCGGRTESDCAQVAKYGCAWTGRCQRPVACESIHDDEDACTAHGCVAHAECD